MELGFAKQYFLEKEGHSPWKKRRGVSVSNLSLLDKLFEKKVVTDFDFFCSEMLIRKEDDEDVAAALSYLLSAARDGHLCVKIKGSELFPSPFILWSEALLEDPSVAGLIEEAYSAILRGFEKPSEELFSEVSGSEIPSTPFCRSGDLFYTQKNWINETLLIESFREHDCTTPSMVFDHKEIENRVSSLSAGGFILPEQAEAVRLAFSESVSLILGGPGTGKTYTAGIFIRLFIELVPKEKVAIILAAPTGKAAAHLESVFGETIPPQHSLISGTLHSLLGGLSEQQKLHADLVIIDESSMIDVAMMNQLFRAVKAGTRIVFLGDTDQLPSVESGAVFHDIIQVKQRDGKPIAQLKTCLRADLKEIVDYSEEIKIGNVERVLQFSEPVIRRFPLCSPQEFVGEIAEKMPSWESEDEVLLQFRRSIILTPLRKGVFGVESLNERIRSACMKNDKNQKRRFEPIIIVRNSVQRKLYNGDFGVLVDGEYALFQGVDGVRKVPAVLLPKFEYAYCMSVHKSQGCEFDRVILLMPNGADVFGREMYYTAVTRARKEVVIYGEDEIIKRTVENHTVRQSGIALR